MVAIVTAYRAGRWARSTPGTAVAGRNGAQTQCGRRCWHWRCAESLPVGCKHKYTITSQEVCIAGGWGKRGELRSKKIHAKPNTTEVREEKAHHRYLQLVHFSNEGTGFGLCVENTCQWRRACTGEQHRPQYDRPVDQPDVGRERRPQT